MTYDQNNNNKKNTNSYPPPPTLVMHHSSQVLEDVIDLMDCSVNLCNALLTFWVGGGNEGVESNEWGNEGAAEFYYKQEEENRQFFRFQAITSLLIK